jgi:hypothetical protein
LRGEGGFEGEFGKGSNGTLDYWFEWRVSPPSVNGIHVHVGLGSKSRQHHTDLLFRVRLKDNLDAYAYILVEHKSSSDPAARLQLLRVRATLMSRLTIARPTLATPTLAIREAARGSLWCLVRLVFIVGQGLFRLIEAETQAGFSGADDTVRCDVTTHADVRLFARAGAVASAFAVARLIQRKLIEAGLSAGAAQVATLGVFVGSSI